MSKDNESPEWGCAVIIVAAILATAAVEIVKIICAK